MAQSCMTKVVRPRPLTKLRARKIHISFPGSMPRRKNSARFAAAAAATPTAQISFLPSFRASFGRKNIKISMGE